jgi:hypothetical protein
MFAHNQEHPSRLTLVSHLHLRAVRVPKEPLMSKFLIGLVVVALISACQSRRVEPQVEEVQGAKEIVEKQKQATVEFDERIQNIIRSMSSFKNLYDKALKVLLNQKGITPVDALVVVLNSTKKGLAVESDGIKKKSARIDLPFVGSKDPCRQIDTIITNKKEETKEFMIIEVRTCFNDQFEILLESEWDLSTDIGAQLTLNLGPIEAIYRKAAKDEIAKQDCTMTNDPAGGLKSLECKDLRLSLSETDDLFIHKLTYTADIEVPGKGRISIRKKTGEVREDVSFIIPKVGLPQRVEHEPNTELGNQP